ncbi:MAG: AAA family ATPase [Rubrivivax sp.]
MHPPKLSVICASPALIDALAADARAGSPGLEVRAQLAAPEAACGTLAHAHDDLVALELPRVGPEQLAQIGQALAERPATALILLTPDSSPGTLLGAMRAGVREVVPLPLVNGEFREAWARQVARLLLQQRAPEPRAAAQVTAFIPAKGGAGATFLATSFAHALAARGARVALIDLNLHVGDAALFLSDQAASMTLADLAAQAGRLDGALLESAMLRCGPGLHVLAAPRDLEAVVGLRAETVARIVELATERFDHVVLDVARVPDPLVLRALDQASRVCLVTLTTLPGLHGARRLSTMLRDLGLPQSRQELVVNRADRGSELAAADLRRTLGFAQAREIPDSAQAVEQAIDRGTPILQHAARDPVARALAEWAAQLVPVAMVRPGTDAPAHAAGWLRSLGLGLGRTWVEA